MVKSVKEILSDAFWIMPATPEYKAEGIPYITSKNIKNGYIDFGNVNYISEEDYEAISKNRPIKNGDILISMIGTLGETAEVTDQDGKFYGQNMFLVRLNSETINKRYFLNYFQSGAVKRALVGSQNQSTQKYLKANHIEDLQIPVLSIEEQAEIANRLDLLSLVITQRKTQLTSLDELIKARFIEMFGDPTYNPNSYPIVQLSNYIEFLTSGSRGWARYCVDDGKEWFITIKNVKDCNIITDNMQTINAPDNAEAKRTKVKEGDLLISITADLGRTGVVTRDIAEHGAYINQHLICIRLKTELLEPLYVAHYLESPAGKIQFAFKNQSAVKAGLNFNSINSLKLLLPPKELQCEFISFINQVNKSKVAVQKALDETQMLFDCLMQEYFG